METIDAEARADVERFLEHITAATAALTPAAVEAITTFCREDPQSRRAVQELAYVLLLTLRAARSGGEGEPATAIDDVLIGRVKETWRPS